MNKTYKNEQLMLFPEQPREVEGLLKEIDRTEGELELIKKAYDASKSGLTYKKNSLRGRLQEACIHPEIRIEDDHDYHNNISWDCHTCTTCGKVLKRV